MTLTKNRRHRRAHTHTKCASPSQQSNKLALSTCLPENNRKSGTTWMDCCCSRDETNMPGGFPHHPSAYGAGAQRAFQSYASPVSAVGVSVPHASSRAAQSKVSLVLCSCACLSFSFSLLLHLSIREILCLWLNVCDCVCMCVSACVCMCSRVCVWVLLSWVYRCCE